jgi:hypothetical protein
LGGKRLPIQFRTDNPDNSDYGNQQPLINDLTYAIPVIKRLTSVETNKNRNHKFKSSAQQNQGRKIVIFSDSHNKGCAGNMKHNLKDS